ncbi:TetR/AcrR family transcriptional regulator [Granulosicoccaceae sp. 1_MG-2023]|nr:TetR/AcrR family transcriptional regulator [Granulosicoccaceae sp. 1_MG-2023]
MDRLIRSGLEALTSRGYSSAGLESILRQAGVPKGSFYHYFPSKEAFGRALLDAYQLYFSARLMRCFDDTLLPPLARLQQWTELAIKGMAKHDYERGCLVGNLATETAMLPADFVAEVEAVWLDWQQRLAALLEEARAKGEIPADSDCEELAEFFWTGWEGAVLRARLQKDSAPMRRFLAHFFRYCSALKTKEETGGNHV